MSPLEEGTRQEWELVIIDNLMLKMSIKQNACELGSPSTLHVCTIVHVYKAYGIHLAFGCTWF